MPLCASVRRIPVALALFAILTGCSGSGDATESGSSDVVESSTAISEVDTTPDSSTSVDEGIELSAAEEAAVGQLDLVLLQLGTEKLVATANCVVDRLKSEGIEITGDGAPELVAALRCEPKLSTRLFNAAAFGFPDAESSCISSHLGEATAAVPLTDAETYFGTPTPPDAVLQTISAVCGISLEELTQSFS